MTDTTTQQQEPAPKLWAIVELFGHQRVAGQISEQNFGGAHLVRVDVPEVIAIDYRTDYSEEPPKCIEKSRRTIAAHTRSFGGGAIYSVNWCDEGTARVAAQSIKHEPLQPYSVAEALRDLPEEHRTRLLGNSSDARSSDDDDDQF